MNKKTKLIVLAGLFVALNIICTRILRPIQLDFIRVSFAFISDSFAGIFLGPILGGISGAVGDIIGMILVPSPAPYFPGFTLSAFLTVFIYGLILRKNPDSIIRVAIAVLIVSVVVDLGLNTLWLSILYKKAWTVFFASRLVKVLILYPVQVVVISLLWKYTSKPLKAVINKP